MAILVGMATWGPAHARASAQALADPATASREPGERTLRALRIEGRIDLDGTLAEPEWNQAEAAAGFVQQDPEVGEPASERSEVRVLVDREALYFGIACHDGGSQGIVARELRRDNALANDDRFEIVLDTFHDHRNSYHFAINPLGTQYDAQVTDEGQDVNVQWDERWYSAAAITERGWTAEIKVPLVTLRSAEGIESFGVNFKRFIRRKNEISHWTGWHRDYKFVQVSRAGALTGLAGVETGLKLRVKPFVLPGFRQAGADPDSGTDALHDVGLEVAKFSLTPGLTAEVTLNTDFAQTEVDDAVVNLTRFPTFFPEKREFFLERAGIFEFAPGGRRGHPVIDRERYLQMFFSRRIGLTEERREVPMLGGAKVVGRAGGFDLGLLTAQTGRLECEPGANYSVLRLKRNVLARSNFGTFFSNRQTGGDDYNRVMGADVNLSLSDHDYIVGFVGKSFTPGRTGDDWVGRAKYNWHSNRYELFLEHLYLGPDFQHDLGYVRRPAIRRSEATMVWQPRPRALPSVRNFTFRGQVVYIGDMRNHLLTREQAFQASASLQSGDALRFNVTDTLDRLERDFEVARGVVIPAREYRYRESYAEAEASGKRTLGGRLRFGFGAFYSGTRRYWQVTPTLRPSAHFSLEGAYEWNDVTLPEGAFTSHVLNGRLNVNLSNRWLTTTLVQYDSAAERKVVYFRLNHIYRPGDDVFLVYNQADEPGRAADRALMLKLTYSFDWK